MKKLLFVKEELDGIIHQKVPQPGHPSSGHVLVTVGEKEIKVDYVRSIVSGLTRSDMPNASVEHTYTIKPR